MTLGGPSEGGASKGSPASGGCHDSEGGAFEGDGSRQGPKVNKGGTSGGSKTSVPLQETYIVDSNFSLVFLNHIY